MKVQRRIKVLMALVAVLLLFGGLYLSSLIGTVRGDRGEIHDAYPILAQNLRRHVEYLSMDCYPRSVGHEENQKKACEYIRRELAKTGVAVRSQEVAVEGEVFENIIATIPGESEELLVIGAHYDSYDTTPGADDNASGVAGVIELCHLLSRHKPKYTIELVAFSNEEPPYFRSEHMGSVHHANGLAGRKVVGMICLEMIGYFSDEEGSQEYPVDALKYIYPTTGNFLAVVGNWDGADFTRRVHKEMVSATPLPVVYLVTPNIENIKLDYSDHRSYWAKNYPAVMVTDTAFYRNKNYHLITDTAASLDYIRMSLGVRGVYHAVRSICEIREAE